MQIIFFSIPVRLSEMSKFFLTIYNALKCKYLPNNVFKRFSTEFYVCRHYRRRKEGLWSRGFPYFAFNNLSFFQAIVQRQKKMARRVIGLGSIILYLLRNSIFIEEERQSYKAVCVHRAPNQGASDKE